MNEVKVSRLAELEVKILEITGKSIYPRDMARALPGYSENEWKGVMWNLLDRGKLELTHDRKILRTNR